MQPFVSFVPIINSYKQSSNDLKFDMPGGFSFTAPAQSICPSPPPPSPTQREAHVIEMRAYVERERRVSFAPEHTLTCIRYYTPDVTTPDLPEEHVTQTEPVADDVVGGTDQSILPDVDNYCGSVFLFES